MATYVTRFGSLADYVKGGIEVIDDDPKHYAFSNVFEVASHAAPWEKVAVGKNMEYVIEVPKARRYLGLNRCICHRCPCSKMS